MIKGRERESSVPPWLARTFSLSTPLSGKGLRGNMALMIWVEKMGKPNNGFDFAPY